MYRNRLSEMLSMPQLRVTAVHRYYLCGLFCGCLVPRLGFGRKATTSLLRGCGFLRCHSLLLKGFAMLFLSRVWLEPEILVAVMASALPGCPVTVPELLRAWVCHEKPAWHSPCACFFWKSGPSGRVRPWNGRLQISQKCFFKTEARVRTSAPISNTFSWFARCHLILFSSFLAT